MNKLMFPNGTSDSSKAKFVASMTKIVDDAEQNASSEDSKARASESFLLVAETGPTEDHPGGEVIAFASWDVWREPRTEEQWNVAEPLSSYTSEGANDEVVEAFLGGIRAMRRRNMRGDPSICESSYQTLSTPCFVCRRCRALTMDRAKAFDCSAVRQLDTDWVQGLLSYGAAPR
jgi:hypothetical protein